MIGNVGDANRFDNVIDFTKKLESISADYKCDDFQVIVKTQSDLRAESEFNGKFENGNWGAKYLRAPEIYNKIIKNGEGKLFPLSKFCKVVYGIKTGANDFFYLTDDTQVLRNMSAAEQIENLGEPIMDPVKFFDKYSWCYSELMKRHYVIEKQFIKPLFKSQREANNLDVDVTKLKYVVFICNHPKKKLKGFKYKALLYINDAEIHEEAPQNRPSCASRASADGKYDWYMLGENIPVGDFIFPSKIFEKYVVLDNRNSKVYCDKVNYNIIVKEEYKKYASTIFALMNSTLFRYFLELFARQMGEGLTDIDVNITEKTLILGPSLFDTKTESFKEIVNSLNQRESYKLYDEIKCPDKRRLDEILFEAIGLSDSIDEFYQFACNSRLDRNSKSQSVKTAKRKGIMTYSDAIKLMKERFSDISKYNELLDGTECREYKCFNLKAKFPVNPALSKQDMFDAKLYVYFKSSDKESYRLDFDDIQQVLLFEFLVKTLQLKDKMVKIPLKPSDAKEVLLRLREDYSNNIGPIKSLLKSYRIKASEIKIYQDLLFDEE